MQQTARPVTRFRCAVCGKLTAGRLPRRGDLSARFPRRHASRDGTVCDGSFREAVWVDAERTAAGAPNPR